MTYAGLVLPFGVYSPGQYRLGFVPVPPDAMHAEVGFDRRTWAGRNAQVHLVLDVSLDGGRTWDATRSAADRAKACPCPLVCGTPDLDDGYGYPVFKIAGGIPDVGNPRRVMRAVLTVTRASIVTSGEFAFRTFLDFGIPITLDDAIGRLRVAA